ncbi:MAG: thioredoxin family protein [Muribaculaceae bacterium]|nr:thioredoxin family protein [Muribaculaceae bacterium]
MNIKTILICALAALSLCWTSCTNNRAKNDSIEKADSLAAAAMGPTKSADTIPYEYFEEVPVPVDGETDPSTMEAINGKIPFVVDFSATWCEPCQRLKPYFKQYAETFKGQAKFVTVDIDEHPELAKKYGVEAVPTVIIFADQSMTQELFRVTGFAPQQIEEALMDNL